MSGEVDPWSDANMLRSIAKDVDRFLASNATGDGAPSSGDTLRDIAARLEALKPADATPAGEAVPADVAALVVAAREACGFLQEHYPTEAVTGALDYAMEAFASRVCWDDEGGSIPDAHADPHTCGLESGEGEGMIVLDLFDSLRDRRAFDSQLLQPMLAGQIGTDCPFPTIKAMADHYGLHPERIRQVVRGERPAEPQVLEALGLEKITLYVPKEPAHD